MKRRVSNPVLNNVIFFFIIKYNNFFARFNFAYFQCVPFFNRRKLKFYLYISACKFYIILILDAFILINFFYLLCITLTLFSSILWNKFWDLWIAFILKEKNFFALCHFCFFIYWRHMVAYFYILKFYNIWFCDNQRSRNFYLFKHKKKLKKAAKNIKKEYLLILI